MVAFDLRDCGRHHDNGGTAEAMPLMQSLVAYDTSYSDSTWSPEANTGLEEAPVRSPSRQLF